MRISTSAKTKTKFFLSLSVLLVFTKANAEMPNLNLPRDFDRLYSIKSNGEIQPRYGTGKKPENIKVDVVDSGLLVSNSSNDTTAWFVGSIPCTQNKELKCVSIYNRKESKSTGNQQSFLNKNRKDDADFTLIQMNPKKSEDNSVIKCGSQFVTGALRDKADLSGCVKYSKSICENWSQVLSSEKNQSLFAALSAKGEECSLMLNQAAELRGSMKSIFQEDIKNSEKEISKNFHEATRDRGGLRVISQVNFKPPVEFSPHIAVYKDLFDRSDDCRNYASVFMSDLTRTRTQLMLNTEEVPGETKAKKSKSTKSRTGQ